MQQINASIVLYHNKKEQLTRVIGSVLNTTLSIKLYLIDNSLTNDLKDLASIDTRIEYIFNDANFGYGKAHNVGLRKSLSNNTPYHLVLNPDIYFNKGVLEELFDYMEHYQDVGNIIPQVRYPDGEIQHLCKLLPTPADKLFRRFLPFKNLKRNMNERYELRFTGYNELMNLPSLSGCFMFLRVDALKSVGLFDENIFMYEEDTDLSRRLFTKYKNIFYPIVEITHEYAKGSYSNKLLLKYHIKSIIYYFNKWGWFFDKERTEINRQTLSKLKKGKEQWIN